jgi:hypothetical protein
MKTFLKFIRYDLMIFLCIFKVWYRNEYIILLFGFPHNIFLIIVMLSGSTLEYLRTFLQCIICILFEFTPSTALFHPPSWIPGTVSTAIIFAFTYMCIRCLDHLNRNSSALLFSNFVEKKKHEDNKEKHGIFGDLK